MKLVAADKQLKKFQLFFFWPTFLNANTLINALI